MTNEMRSTRRPRALVINGKFLTAELTGVHRVANELIRELETHADELVSLFGSMPVIVAPRTAEPTSYRGRFPLDRRSILSGDAWEQIELPIRTREKLLLGLCNMAPVVKREAITMIHDAQVFSTPESYSFAFRRICQTIMPLIGRRNRCILTGSHFAADELVRYRVATADRIRVFHDGADHGSHAVPDPTIIARLGLAPGSYVLALSSTQKHKNVRILLQAFARTELAGFTLVLFGSTAIERLMEAGLSVPINVVYAGRVPDAQLAGLMQGALCFATPSTTEGFGLPPLEAMAQGCPAIVAPCGALPEVCGDAALYADPDKPEQWSDAIVSLATQAALRSDLIARGAHQVRQMSWKRAGDALMDVLRESACEPASR